MSAVSNARIAPTARARHGGADGRKPRTDSIAAQPPWNPNRNLDDAMSEADLRAGRYTIPGNELTWQFGTSGGPGGQHANKASTRAELRWAAGDSTALPSDVKARVVAALHNRISNGVLTVAADDSRSQWRNRSIARSRMAELIEEASRPPKARRPTTPSRSAKRRRLEAKRRRSEKKQLRGRVDPQD
jgi:ribosome-associated protein